MVLSKHSTAAVILQDARLAAPLSPPPPYVTLRTSSNANS